MIDLLSNQPEKCSCNPMSVWLKKIPAYTLRNLYFHFLSQWMGYDRGDSFWTKWKFHLEIPNSIPFTVKGNRNIVFSVQQYLQYVIRNGFAIYPSYLLISKLYYSWMFTSEQNGEVFIWMYSVEVSGDSNPNRTDRPVFASLMAEQLWEP